jgi:hypothetical protein
MDAADIRHSFNASRRLRACLCGLVGALAWLAPLGAHAQPLRGNNCANRNGDFGWSCAGPLSGMECTQILETADPHGWADNYYCSTQPLGMRWSSAGPLPGMRCTQILEPTDPHTWADNYLCLPPNAPVELTWSYAGPVPGMSCVQWSEPSDPYSWSDNYLCSRGAMAPPPPVLGCAGGCGPGQVCVNAACVGTGPLRITMTWDQPGDMDLHVITPAGTELSYANRTGDGGELDRDDTRGTGPENIFWSTAAPPGRYLICANAYSITQPTTFAITVDHSGTVTQNLRGQRAASAGNRRCEPGSPDFVTEYSVGSR